MTGANTKIREAKNLVNLKGVLTRKSTREISLPDGGVALAVSLEVEVEENNKIPVEFFVSEKKSDGTENGLYKGVQTIADEYEEGDVVVISSNSNFAGGSLENNEYFTEAGQYNARPQIKAISAHRERESDKDKPHGVECQLEGYITYIDREIKDDEETGNLLIKIVTPKFGGRVDIFTLIMQEEFAESAEQLYNVGDTVEFIVHFKNEVVTKVVKTQMAIGKDHEQAVTSYKRGLVVTQSGYPRSDGLEYTEEQIQRALAEREVYLEERKQKAMNKSKTKKTGAIGGEAGGKSNALGFEDDIPF